MSTLALALLARDLTGGGRYVFASLQALRELMSKNKISGALLQAPVTASNVGLIS
jgi:hypothetical protein